MLKTRPHGISVIIHTKNEEQYIRNCIRSAKFLANEVIVVDMQSTDNTREIALAEGARVESVADQGFADPARENAIQASSYEWVFSLDADELITPELAEHLKTIAQSGEFDAVQIPRITYMFGKRIYGTGWDLGRERHWRFFRVGYVYSPNKVHSPPRPIEKARTLKLQPIQENAFIHFNYSDWQHFYTKLNAYTSIHASEDYHSGIQPSLIRTLKTVVVEILRRGVIGKMWRDKHTGLYLLYSMTVYRTLVHIKLSQLYEVGDEKKILNKYSVVARATLHQDESTY